MLYLPRGEAAHYAFVDVPGMLRTFRETGFRLGIISGFTAADAAFTQHRLVGGLYEVSDAVGIAVFTVSGVAVAVSSKTTPIWLWGPLLATLTAAGGRILRDVVCQSGNIVSLRVEFYAEVPMIWGLLLSLCLLWQTPRLDPNEFILAVIITMVGAFATRMTAVLLRLRSPDTRRIWTKDSERYA